MTEPISSRQQVLMQLWEAPKPHAVWVILVREATYVRKQNRFTAPS